MNTLPTSPRAHRICRPAVGILLATILGASVPCGFAADQAAGRRVTADDLPRIPPTEPADALATFRLARSFRLELVAAEPLVADPVDACFDEFGRMYVAEMHGYPFSQEPTKLNPAGGGQKDAGIIRLLEDTDGDGRMDRSTVFAEGISWPTSVCCYAGGLFVLAPQFLYYFKDTNGDHRADVREVVLEGFGRDNVQSVANSLKWGLDNQIYLAAGRNPVQLVHRGKPLFAVRGNDLRFDPRTEAFEMVTGGQQFGMSMDDWGNRFVCSNSNHIEQVVFPLECVSRNPYLAAPGLIRSIASDGAAARVFRSSPPEPWRIIRQQWRAADKGYRLVINEDGAWEFVPLDPSKEKGAIPTEYPVGYFTSATGITIYRGDAYPPEFRGNAFVGDVGGNLVHRKTLRPNGVAFRADRADADEEFIRSTDNWFRPVNFVNAPDGTLYVLDMYRETVEHPYSIPDEIKQFLHLYSGDDRGRIYRIVSPDMKRSRPPGLGELSAADLVAALESDNAWQRETAQRLLWERQDRSVAGRLDSLVSASTKPLARLHALRTLDGLDALSAETLLVALQDSEPRLREHAIRLAEPRLAASSQLFEAVLARCEDEDVRVRFQLAFSLGAASSSQALEGLLRMARDPRNLDSDDIRTAMLTSCNGVADRLAAEILADEQLRKQPPAGTLLAELALIVGAARDAGAVVRLLASATSADLPLATQQVVLASLGEGLTRRGSSLTRVLTDEDFPASLRAQIDSLFERAIRIAGDGNRPLTQRVQAIGLLAFADFDKVADALPELLTPQVPQSLQRAAVAALSQQDAEQAAGMLLRGWRTYSPQVRRDVSDAMLARPERVLRLLEAIESKGIGIRDLERDQKQLLLAHPNAKIHEYAGRLFGGEVTTDRDRVVADYQKVLELDGSPQRGFEVFKRRCAVCHRLGNVGHQVAPDLASVQNKSPGDLLIAILDPNRESQPNFNTYNVLTLDDRVFNGIIATESANSITLRRAEAKEDVILRSNIESLVATGISLMPEGLEKDLSPEDLADVIAFVKKPEIANRKP